MSDPEGMMFFLVGRLIGILIIVTPLLFAIRELMRRASRRKERIADQVRRIQGANKPGFKQQDNMETVIKDGVVTYRRKKKK